jgi:pimeloyl-ACP methyl ester carboxylesterase
MADTKLIYSIRSVTSHDGTIIGYRQMGSGPGLILIHGGMASSQTFMTLATILSDDFTVYIPDRRGRGLSGPFGNNYCIQKEIEDLDAIISKTDAHYIFGLSSGAVIAIKASLHLHSINKLALYEPPLAIDHSMIEKHDLYMQRFDHEIINNELGAAFVTILKGLEIMPFPLNYIPRFLLVPFFTMAIKEDAKNVKENDVSLVELIPTQHFDYQLIIETKGSIVDFKGVCSQVLLLGGSKSPMFLKHSLDKLNNMLICAKRIEFRGLGHTAPIDNKQPEQVAHELRKFFITNKCKQKK